MNEQKFTNSFLANKEYEYFSAFAVANYILDFFRDEPITNLKLQKLLFFSYGFHLVYFSEKLFNTSIHAWKLGPVIKPVYLEFKNHGRDVITTHAKILLDKDDSNCDENSLIEPSIDNVYKNEKTSILSACLYYGRYDASTLVNIAHNMSSWINAIQNSPFELSDKDIFADFQKCKSEIIRYVNNECK